MPVISFATSGLIGSELDTVVKSLCSSRATSGTHSASKTSFLYEPAITPRTTLLITCTSTSTKFLEARRRKITTVTPKWALETRGDMSLCGKYMASPLLGQLISTAALDTATREEVKGTCALLGSQYQASLCRRCTLLVIPSGGVPSGNEKVSFAHKYNIRLASIDEFRLEFGSFGGGAAQPHAAEDNSNAFLETPIVQTSLDGVCCYCVPSPVPASVIRTLVEARCSRVPAVTPSTTHIVVWKDGACETLLAPQCGEQPREVVSIKWIEACLKAKKRLPETLFRLKLPSAPVITFSAVSPAEKTRLAAMATSASLMGVIQDSLVLGSVEQLRRDPRQNELRLTTHLVLPSLSQEHLDGFINRKVDVMVKRFVETKRAECKIVSVHWIIASAEAGKWVDPTPYAAPIRQVVSANLAAALQRQQLTTEEQRCVRSALEEARRATSVPHVVGARDPLETLTSGAKGQGVRAETQGVLSLEALVSKLEDQAQLARSPLLQEGSGYQFRTAASIGPCAPVIARGRERSLWDEPNIAFGVGLASAPTAVVESQVVYYRHSQDNAVGSSPSGPDSVALPPPPPLLLLTPRRFFLAKSIRDEANGVRIVESLGGSIAELVEECTHFIVPKPAKTETFLRCVASSGKWVLAPSYLARCAAAGRFVDEGPDEWGSANSSVPPAVGTLAAACPLQRRSSARVFATWRVVLSCSEIPRAQSFSRVLEAGGCTNIRIFPPEALAVRANRQAVRDSTHVLCDDGCLSEEVLRCFAADLGITVHRMELMVHVLCSTTQAPENFRALDWLVSRKRAREADEAGALC
jgi:hypothetical protein